MVALSGTESSLNSVSNACVNNGNQPQQSALDMAQSLQTSMNTPQAAATQHISAIQINLPTLNNVSMQFTPQQNNDSSVKHELQSSSRYSNSNCILPSHRYGLLMQTRPVECYHPTGAAGATYMPNNSGGAQTSAPATLRVQPTPQPSAPPAPQQEMSKNNIANHNNYVSQNQTPQTRPQQYPNFPYRATQHGTRPTTHPRQQQPFIPGTAATTGPVMYPVVFQSTHMGLPTYQQPRSSAPYYPYVSYIPGYNTNPSHTPQYYYPSNSPQLSTPNSQTNTPGRSNPTTLVGAQNTAATPTAPTATLPHQPPTTLMHQGISGIRPAVQKRSHRLPIIDPVTQQDIMSDLYSNDGTSDSSDRQTPQPEPPTHSIAEEFTRMVNEVANQPSDSTPRQNFHLSKNVVDIPMSSTVSLQHQTNAINSLNNNNKSEVLTNNECKNLGLDINVEVIETPIVSAISDSPVIVPKMPMNIKQLQKNSEQNVLSLVIDTNKNLPLNMQHKSKNVPEVEDIENSFDNISSFIMSAPATTASSITPMLTSLLAPVFVPASAFVPVPTQVSVPIPMPTPQPQHQPQPQRIREPRERLKSEEKERNRFIEAIEEREIPPVSSQPNGPTPFTGISSVDSLSNAIDFSTSQNNQGISAEPTNILALVKQRSLAPEPEILIPVETKAEVIVQSVQSVVEVAPPTATELLSASIEKLVKEHPIPDIIPEIRETSSAIEAQVKLTQSLSNVLRAHQSELKMKDININNKTADPDAANGNTTELTKTDTANEDINKNENLEKTTKNNNKMASNDDDVEEMESFENGKDETDKIVNDEQEITIPTEDEIVDKPEPTEQIVAPPVPPALPKYKYTDDQWSPFNKSGKKCYDIGLLKQIKDDPLSKNKPNAPLLEACNVIRTTPMQEPIAFTNISRPVNDSLFPPFAKGSGMGPRNNPPREPKKDSGRTMTMSGRGSMKLASSPSGSSSHKPVIHVCLRDEVKLNEVDSAWKPTRFRQDTLDQEDHKTQELYKKFRGILNKLTPQKFDTLLDRIKTLEINNQKRLEGVIDLVFEKAIDEPNFSEAYAAMCNKLSKLKVPADNAISPDQCVNFRALIINKCQNQFEANKVDEQILKLEKDLSDCTDPTKKKELHLMLVEENRRLRMRSVGNVRFIGELYKLKMLTSKIMDYCMKYLIDKLEEEKLECLCKLLTTIGEQIENEVHGQLDSIFKKMQEIVDRKSSKITSRVRFMLQDVIELRKRKWVIKSVVDSQPKMMDQIQKEAEQQQRHIELMNAAPMGGGFRRDDGGRSKRGDGRRQNANNSFMDSTWKTSKHIPAPVDTSKFKAAVAPKNISNIKLAPQQNFGWTYGSGTKNTAQAAATSNSMISFNENKFSALATDHMDPSSIRGNRELTPSYHSKGASIERSTFSRGDFATGGSNRSGSVNVVRPNSGTRSTSVVLPISTAAETPAPLPAGIPQEALPDAKKKSVKSMIDLCLINPDDDEMVSEVKQLFSPQYHASVVNEILNVTLEKSAKDVAMIIKSLLYLVSTSTISPDNFIEGLKETFEIAPDLYIDIPMLYEYLGMFVAPHIEKKHITFVQIFRLSNNIVSSKQAHLFLKAIIRELSQSMGPTFTKSRWQESGLQLKEWMDEDQVAKWIEDNKFEFLEGGVKASEESKNILTPAETQAKLLQLMNTDENCECIKGWVQDKFNKSSNDDWFIRSLVQAICEHALFGPEGRDVPHFNQDRMNKYVSLVHEFGETKQSREASCLFGIQQLIHRLEHPQGLTLEIFQYLHEQYVISLDGFIAWEESEKEPEGKGVMLKALTSFFTNIKEADNEDSCSEE